MKLLNLATNQVIAERVVVADTFFKRLRGFMLTYPEKLGYALHLTPCRSIHTFMMKSAIDVLYLDVELRVVAVEEHLKPGRFGKKTSRTVSVMELQAGSIAQASVQVGDQLQLVNGVE